MNVFPLKAGSTYVKAYYAALKLFKDHDHTTEGNTRSAFADLLKRCSSAYDWHLVEEYQFKGVAKQPLRADGALVDALTLVHGLWEAKDSADDLQREIKSKVAKGYPLTNILFQSPDRAVLYQDNRIALDCDLSDSDRLIEILQLFFEHRQQHEVDWKEAVYKFSEKIPELAAGVTLILEDEHKTNKGFRLRFQAFADLCRTSINPDLTDPAIQKMLVQHLLTERIFRKVFDNSEFLQRNVIAAEIEKVIQSITAKHFSRDTFLRPLDRFYKAIEEAALTQTGYTEKQHFLNAVYEKFFQSFDKNQADTHGIVYTPQPIVDFMVRSVEEVLKSDFSKSLSDQNVHILDPFTGTGNFITRIMQQIRTSRLPQKYAEELHCNEVMLLPYYIASMNIEHAYMEKTGQYATFEGICLVDTFDLAEPEEMLLAFMTEGNTERILKQKKAPIMVVIGNPPYNMGQVNENDQNKNRKYRHMDRRVQETYTADSKATLRNKLGDPYVKAFRLASDRIRATGGVVAYVSNNSFIDQIAFDGMRKNLISDFSSIYVIDLGGNIRQNPKLSGTTHNVFGIQVGVAITILIKDLSIEAKPAVVRYARMPENWRRSQKAAQLDEWTAISGVNWTTLTPDARNTWLTEGQQEDFAQFLPMGNKETKGTESNESIFNLFSLGLASNRDAWVYNHDPSQIMANLRKTVKAYNAERSRYQDLSPEERKNYKPEVQESEIKWTDRLVEALRFNQKLTLDPRKIQASLYRPYCRTNVYFDHLLNQRRYQQHHIFPLTEPPTRNKAIWLKTGSEVAFWALATDAVPDLLPQGGSQCFPFFVYDEDGSNQRENITDWSLQQYRAHYGAQHITKWDIFHAVYAVLHHPNYRARYAANLKRELPRTPFPPDFKAFAEAGERLMDLHLGYESQAEFKLEELEKKDVTWTMRVQKMVLNKDKTELRYNDALTLRGIPPEVFEYRLGTRSALEWVVDQYQFSTDSRSGIVDDPNRPDDERYILRLIGQVITVSLQTKQLVDALPDLVRSTTA